MKRSSSSHKTRTTFSGACQSACVPSASSSLSPSARHTPLSGAYTPPQSQRGLRGFALIIALSLMAFIFLLLVSLSSLVSVEVAQGSSSDSLNAARQNALYGFHEALGKLQETMGPDRRVNAPAALNTNTPDMRKHWVGVYDSWTSAQTNRPNSPSFVRWLVSGNDAALKNRNSGYAEDDAAIGTSFQELILGDADDRVEVGLVDIASNGGYAWWIGDENAKAGIRANTTIPDDDDERLVRHLAVQQTPAASGHELVAGLADIARGDERLGHIVDRRNLGLLTNQPQSQSHVFHTVSPYSTGLLTNVRKGGLRQDLSLYLEKPVSTATYNSLRGIPLYTHGEYKNAPRSGVHFGELWAYYNLYRRLQTASGAHPDGGSLPANVPMLAGEANNTNERRSAFANYNRPVVIRGGWIVSLRTTAKTTGEPAVPTGEYKIELVTDPILMLWNPYDVSIKVPSQAPMKINISGPPYDVQLYKNGAELGTKQFFAQMAGGWGTGKPYLSASLMVGDGNGDNELNMRPGEVLLLSQAGEEAAVTEIAGDIDGVKFETKPGWNHLGGLVFDTKQTALSTDEIGIALTPSTRRGYEVWALFQVSESIGESETAGALRIDRRYWNNDNMKATDHPDIFTPVIHERIASAADFEGQANKYPFAFFSVAMRTEDSDIPGRFLARATRAFLTQNVQSLDEKDRVVQNLDVIMKKLSGPTDNPGFDTVNAQGYFGGSYTAASGTQKLITQSVPRAPIFSIAAFQHAAASGLHDSSTTGTTDQHYQVLQPIVARIIGNSHALPIFAPNASTGFTNDNMDAIDHSYHANLALWDDWFFSSIAPKQAKIYTDAGINQTQKQVLENFASGAAKLPNTRMQFQPNGTAQKAIDDIFSGAALKTDAHLKSASHLNVAGAFNVNSTNPDAWAALLASLRGEAVATTSGNTGAISWEDNENVTPIPGLLLPADSAVGSNDLNNPNASSQWLGYRTLDDTQIRALAEEIVKEVQKRGPFLSLADFVNRRLSTDTTIAKSGALQTALDRAVNVPLMGNSRLVTTGDLPAGLPFPEAETGPRSVGSAGYIDQADLLTPLGPLLTPRSDTFVIRSYGEVRDNNGRVTANARCEAIVQRIAAYVSTEDDPHLAYDQINETNQRFGRQFRIISFRWLNDSDV